MPIKLIKDGDSFLLAFDPELLERLNIDENTPLEITAKNGELLLRRADTQAFPDDFDEIVEQINQRYAPVFRKLAE